MRGMVDNALAGMKNQVTPVPVIHSLDELYLISDAHWENGADIRDMQYLRTLVVKQPGAIALLLFGMGLIGMCILLFSLALEDSDSIVGVTVILLLFFGVGVWLFYTGIMTYAKVRIRIFRDRLEIRRGFRKNGKYRIYKRSYQDTPVNIKADRTNKDPVYHIVILNGYESYTLVSGLSSDYYGYATEYKRMLDTILKAEL